MKDLQINTPPQALDAEKAVLAGLLMENSHHDYIDLIKAEFFYFPAHRDIFTAIEKLHREKKAIDMITVSALVPEHVVYLSQITGLLAGSLHLPEHLAVVIQKYFLRRMSAGLQKLHQAIYLDHDVEDLAGELNALSVEMSGLLYKNVKTNDLHEIFDNCLESLRHRKAMADTRQNIGCPCPLGKLQSTLGGWQPSELIILAARPSMGKTAFALKIATFAAIHMKKVLFISMEMSSHLLADRLLIGASGLNSEKYKTGHVSNGDIFEAETAAEEMSGYYIRIVDEGSLSVEDIYSTIKRERPDLVLIDYIQLIRRSSGLKFENRNQEVGHISRTLKLAAKDFGVPVIALSQLSRAVEARSDKRPLLSDLRESGDLEQDADVVMFLYRNSYYFDNDTAKVMRISIKKNRNGRTGELDCNYNENLTDFYDIPEPEFPTSDMQPTNKF